MNSQQTQRRIGLAVALLVGLTLLGLVAAYAIDNPRPLVYTWEPPESGPPVVRYVVQLSVNDAGFADFDSTSTPLPFYLLDVNYGNKYLIRVAGVDSDGDRGPFSVPSEAVTPEIGPPPEME